MRKEIIEAKLSSLEVKFLNAFRHRYVYLSEKLHRGNAPYEGRKFQSDFVLDFDSHPRFKGVVIECQGGIFAPNKSGHSSGTKLVRDYEKCVLAQINGYFFLPVPPTKNGISNACDVIDKLYLESQEMV